ncbi:MAG: hypothetical protein GY874_23075 [Desulfobacteraceae bacterium]|nr:hypothetical protein [Desulfobacteraceae bacterium]
MPENDQQDIAFFGKMVAASTHEIKNVLAVIKESSGLMEDFLKLSGDSPSPYHEKLLSTLTIIINQIQRGTGIMNHLNRFAHLTDNPNERINIGDVLDIFLSLSTRFSRNKNIMLTIRPVSVDVTLDIHPLKLLMMLFSLLECALETLPPSTQIFFEVQKSHAGVVVWLSIQTDLSRRQHFKDVFQKKITQNNVHEQVRSMQGSINMDEEAFIVRVILPESTLFKK